MSTSINPTELSALTETLARSLQKPSRPRSATHIYSRAGHEYRSGSISSDSSLFDITSEHGALVQALQHNDFELEYVVSITEEQTASPLAIKILRDYASRIGTTFAYAVYTTDGTCILSVDDIHTCLEFYAPTTPVLEHLKTYSYINHTYQLTAPPTIEELKKFATLGMQHHFLSAETGSRYGCAIVSEDGSVYIGGAYGSPDKRLGLHAEMATIAGAIARDARNITHIAIIATKYPDTPCPVCGHCRQVLTELLNRVGGTPDIVCLSSESDAYEIHTLDELLPHQWTSKKW